MGDSWGTGRWKLVFDQGEGSGRVKVRKKVEK